MLCFSDLFNYVYPHYCIGCNTPLQFGESVLCTSCILQLPYTSYETYSDNPVAKMLFGRVNFKNAASVFFFTNKGCVQHLLHQLKYKGKAEIGLILGKLMGYKLASAASYKGIDFIIPLPLDIQKQKKRGYNQSEMLAKGMLMSWNTTNNNLSNCKILTDLLLCSKKNESQTHKTRKERWENVYDKFFLNENYKSISLEKKHILLVDDVITTGATLESAASALLRLPEIELSVVTAASPT